MTTERITDELMMTHHCFVYLLTFQNGKQYVGVSNNPRRRYSQHRRSQTPCGEAFRKHGDPVLDLVIIAERDYCFEIEGRLTDTLGTVTPNGYNLQRGGCGGSIPSAISREKMRQSHIGKTPSQETLERMKAAQQRRPLISEETRVRLKQAAKRRGMSDMVRKAASEANRGRVLTEEQRKLQSDRTRLWWSERKRKVLTCKNV